ncbi:MAG: DUF1926 domain-containing protein [Treponema sp.]|nr:DUF1926 domain-containing protein [Treponema sp.]
MKEDKILLVLGSHDHVPSGAPEEEFEYAYENRMRPFVSNLYRYSNVQAVLHYSGTLLYWVERTHPEFFMLIEDMAARKQVEILGGGFYEPLFPLIPLQDRIGQIELLTTYLRKHFGKRALGCWIPNMAWEQHMVYPLCSSDMNYTFLSQDQFVMAGMSGNELYYPCISEDQGKLITIFPVALSVEEELAHNSFSQVFTELKNKFLSSGGKGVKVVSVFPRRISCCEEEAPDTAWNRFFEEISLSENIVETSLPAKILKNHKAYRRASFPNSSSIKNDYSPRRFLIEHDEANGIYSKMIFTNVLINQLKGDKYRKLNAREELWKAQDSFLFSPGDGRLRSELRKSAYSSLLRAEGLSREKGKIVSSLIQHDFDLDGVKEYLFQDNTINCYIQPKGASVFELDYTPKEWNYLDCGSTLFYNSDTPRRRAAFADILLPADFNINQIDVLLANDSRHCYNEQYESADQDKKGKFCFMLPAVTSDIPFACIEIQKCYLIKKSSLSVSYALKNTGKETQKFIFTPEIDLSFAGVTDDYVRFYSVDNSGKDVPVERDLDTGNLKILDITNEVQILIASSSSFGGCLIQASNENIYQATRIIPAFPVTLESGEIWKNDLNLKFSH